MSVCVCLCLCGRVRLTKRCSWGYRTAMFRMGREGFTVALELSSVGDTITQASRLRLRFGLR